MVNRAETFRQVVPEELDRVMQLFREVAVKMNREGMYNWDDSYPDRDTVMNDISNREMYLCCGVRLSGVVTVTWHQPDEYRKIRWRYNDNQIAVIRRLAVRPEDQGKGIARKLMEFAECQSEKLGATVVRLDVYNGSHAAQRLYDTLGYSERGTFSFAGSELTFTAMEKRISGGNITT